MGHIDYNSMGDTMQKGRNDKPLHVMHITLPNGLNIQVNQWNEPGEGAYLNAKISLPQGYAGAIDGHCGNFNGNPEDDARLMVRARWHPRCGSSRPFIPWRENAHKPYQQ